MPRDCLCAKQRVNSIVRAQERMPAGGAWRTARCAARAARDTERRALLFLTFGKLCRAQPGEVGRHAEAVVDELVAERGRQQHCTELDIGRLVRRVHAQADVPHVLSPPFSHTS